MNHESLKGFLPPNSFVMGKKKAAPQVAPAPQSVSYLFIGPVSGNSEILLQKMIDAMKVDRTKVKVAASYSEVSGVDAIITIALGDLAINELTGAKPPFDQIMGQIVRNDHGNQILVTFHPDQLIQNPALKKESWEHLKKAIKVVSGSA